MNIEQFRMERLQSTWENVVEYNLSESGVHPLALRELLGDREPARDHGARPRATARPTAPPASGPRSRGLYPGAWADQVLATAGSSEANFLLMWSLIEPGDEVVFMMPNYMQMWGLARGFGARSSRCG